MIIIVIHSPLARLTTLTCRPFAYILHVSHYIKRCLHFSLSYIYISHFKFLAPSPAGQAGEASRPKFTNLKTLHNFSGGKGLKTEGGVELAGLPA